MVSRKGSRNGGLTDGRNLGKEEGWGGVVGAESKASHLFRHCPQYELGGASAGDEKYANSVAVAGRGRREAQDRGVRFVSQMEV